MINDPDLANVGRESQRIIRLNVAIGVFLFEVSFKLFDHRLVPFFDSLFVQCHRVCLRFFGSSTRLEKKEKKGCDNKLNQGPSSDLLDSSIQAPELWFRRA